LLTLTAQLGERVDFEEIFMVSASTGDGVADLKAALSSRMPEGPWHFPEDQVSTPPTACSPLKSRASSSTSSSTPSFPTRARWRTEKYEERRDGSVAIHQQILVGRDTQRAIVLGKGGSRLKQIGSAARESWRSCWAARSTSSSTSR
jgi:GTP-binding protein Era